jgi:hypothetical protein
LNVGHCLPIVMHIFAYEYYIRILSLERWFCP